jgi:hypothetical protein
MIGNADTVAVTAFRLDLTDIAGVKLGAAQCAISVGARRSIVDENEAHHVSLRKIESRPVKRLRGGVTSVRPFADKDSDRTAAIPVIATW